MSNTGGGSDSATGSAQQQQPDKRKIKLIQECRTGSIPSVTENLGPVAKKKFTATIPSTRAKETVDSKLLEERKPAQPYRGVPQRQNRGRGGHIRNDVRLRAQQGFQPQPEYKPPAPRQPPVLIQTEGTLFGQGVAAADSGSDSATGSAQQQQPYKGSIPSVTENVGPVAKKRYPPNIPPTRAKKTVDSKLLEERKPVQPYRGVHQRQDRGQGGHVRNDVRWRAQQGFQPQPEYKPPAPRQSRVLIQTEGTLFGQGVAASGKEKRAPRSNKSKIQACYDPVMFALNAVDQYEDNPNNNVVDPNVVDLKSTLSAVAKANEESHRQMDQFVLETGSQIKNEDQVVVNQKMFKTLKYHQIEGIKFMWNACFRSNSSAGCVLAHCMGLGKSLQVVTLSHTVLTNAICEVNRVMVVCPPSTVLNWEKEFKKWLPENSFESLNVCELASSKTIKGKKVKITKWFQYGGVMIVGYEMFRSLTKKEEENELVWQALVDPGPDLLICDEGHLLKNQDTDIYKSMNRISTRRRVMLSGTPLQNNLIEFFSMVEFVHPGLLGTITEFETNFVKVLERGQSVDATELEFKVMKRRAFIFQKLLEDVVQRFESNVLGPFLPPKYDYVVSVRMSQLQIKLYQHYLDKYTKGGAIHPTECKIESAGLLSHHQQLSRVCSHPKALLLSPTLRYSKNDLDSKTGKNSKNEDDISWTKEPDLEDGCIQESEDPASSSPWWSDLISDDEINKIEHSGKMLLLIDILRQCELIGDKLLVFSQHLTTLDLIEEFLAIEEAKGRGRSAGNASEFSGKWNLNMDYFRLDGSTSSEQRLKRCIAFNDPKNPRARLFLISTKAGGIGINLTGGNRVIIFDASWNPSNDLQSVFRVYRLGQNKPCYVYRFVAQGTMEEKVYYRQIEKLALARRIIDAEQIERHFASNDLTDLYTFDADGLIRLPDSVLGEENSLHPNDELLSELAVRKKEWIGAYRLHDSLLHNRPEEYIENTKREAIWKLFREKVSLGTSKYTKFAFRDVA